MPVSRKLHGSGKTTEQERESGELAKEGGYFGGFGSKDAKRHGRNKC